MKKNIIIIAAIVLVICAIVFEIIILKNNKIEIAVKQDNFIYLGKYEDMILEEDSYVFKNYDEFNKLFESVKEITEDNFNEHNYAAFEVVYDECSEEDINPINYTIIGNSIEVNAEYTAKCGVCAPQYIYYLIEIDKNINDAKVDVKYHAKNNPHCNPNVTYKPMIYLYPEHEMKVNVKLGYKDLLTVTYPKYNDGWNVIAKENGRLIGEDNRTYYGLYWEGLNNFDSDFKDGFVVRGKDVASFLEEKLEILGLNEIESNEFIVYWLPKLEVNEYNLIRFESLEKINEQMPLEITPSPDTIIRVLMEYKALDKNISINEQVLTKAERKGFTVVEWGGSLIK